MIATARRHLAKRLRRGGGTLASAEELLGTDHPLTRTLDLIGILRRQLTATSLAGIGCAAGMFLRIEFARSALIAAVAVEFVLAAALAAAVAASRERARDLLIEGREVDLPVIARERRRLLSERRRYRLAYVLEDLVRYAERCDRVAATYRPLYDPLVVRHVGPELRALASGLRAGTASVRTVARVERLLTDGTSPLFGTQAEDLRAELASLRADAAFSAPLGEEGSRQQAERAPAKR